MFINDMCFARQFNLVFSIFFFSSRRRHTRSLCDWSSDVCSSDLCALVAVFFNRFVLRALGGGRLFRGDERRHPWSSGIVIYPFSVLLLLVLFRNRMEVAAAAWGVLAAGDAAAGAFGRWRGRRAPPWNHRKTIEGSVAFAIAPGVAAAGLLLLMGRPAPQGTAP